MMTNNRILVASKGFYFELFRNDFYFKSVETFSEVIDAFIADRKIFGYKSDYSFKKVFTRRDCYEQKSISL